MRWSPDHESCRDDPRWREFNRDVHDAIASGAPTLPGEIPGFYGPSGRRADAEDIARAQMKNRTTNAWRTPSK
jgi:hypothetical protein